MNFSVFQTNLIKNLNALTSPGISVQLQLIKKNNTTDRVGLVLFDEHEREQMISPIAYPDDLYQMFLSGSSMEEVTDFAWQILHTPAPPEMDFRIFEDREYILKHAVLRLVGRQRNEECLKDACFREFLDFAVTIGILIRDGERSYAMAVLTRGLFDTLGITENELFRRAAENSAAYFGDSMKDMNLLMHKPGKDAEVDPEHLTPSENGRYILTNRGGFYGATVLMYSQKLRQLAESLKRDLLILPVSIHEVILLPETGEEDVESIRAFVADVNRSEIPREYILTDNVYRYSRERDCIEFARAV